MQNQIKQVAWGYLVDAYGVRVGAQTLEELNLILKDLQAENARQPKEKVMTRARLSRIKQE